MISLFCSSTQKLPEDCHPRTGPERTFRNALCNLGRQHWPQEVELLVLLLLLQVRHCCGHVHISSADATPRQRREVHEGLWGGER
jgi:hypothetical protein